MSDLAGVLENVEANIVIVEFVTCLFSEFERSNYFGRSLGLLTVVSTSWSSCKADDGQRG